nr:MAG TPA: hypothetical protein [Caudoviricetes sp.]
MILSDNINCELIIFKKGLTKVCTCDILKASKK